MAQEIILSSSKLPSNPTDLSEFIAVGNEAVTAERAHLRAMQKIGAANEDRLKVLAKAQKMAEVVLDAEVRLGTLISEMTTEQGKRTDLELGLMYETKSEAIEQIGISKAQANRYELLAKHPEIVNKAKIDARNIGEIVNQTTILRAISESKKPFVTNNSGNGEWFTPPKFIASARKVMGGIDLDPASCQAANAIVQADRFYTAEDDGLLHEWSGKIWLNPPFALVARFVEKLLSSDFEQAIVLTNNATETGWMKSLAEKASAMVFHTGRLAFLRHGEEGEEKSKPMQGQVFSYIGPNPDAFLDEFSSYGWGAKPVKNNQYNATD